MSISIILIPLALPAIPVLIGLRLALGKERFTKLMQSMEIRLPTNLRVQGDLETTLLAAGYDFVPWLGKWKTHLPMRGEFLTWAWEEERWKAIFSKGIAQDVIARFISDLEAKSGRAIFSDIDHLDPQSGERHEPISTNFADEALLVKTLAEWGGEVEREPDGVLRCSMAGTVLQFARKGGEAYRVEVREAKHRPEILRQLMSLDEDYKRGVQTQVYQGLKARIRQTDLRIESEEVLEDNSIVLTLVVEDHA